MSTNTILASAPLTATGYHLKATGTTLGQSLIWDNGTNVGIGNTNTSYTLDVSGTGRFTSDLLVVRNATMSSYVANVTGTAGAGVGSQFLLQDGGTNVAWFRRNRDGAGVTELANVDGTFIIKTGATAAINALTIASTGAATFSSSVTISGADASTAWQKFYTGGTYMGYIGSEGGWNSNVYTDFVIGATSGRQITFYTNGTSTAKMTILSGGNTEIYNSLSVGTTIGSNVRLTVQGGDSTSSNYAIDVKNSTTTMFFVRNDGYMYFGLSANSPYNIAQSGRTCILASNGSVGYLVSTRESKANIESIKSIDFINQLNPVQFNYRKKDNITNTFTDKVEDNITYGFIADEVEKVNKELVFYNTDNTLAGVEYNSMIAILTKAIQEQQIQIQNLQEQINILAK